MLAVLRIRSLKRCFSTLSIAESVFYLGEKPPRLRRNRPVCIVDTRPTELYITIHISFLEIISREFSLFCCRIPFHTGNAYTRARLYVRK